MCMMVYLAAPSPLALVPWNEEAPAFHVTAIRPNHGVRFQFSFPHFCYVGSHESCGCGFQIGECAELEEREEEHAEMRSCLDAFADYLERHLARAGKIEVFACWDGNQCEPVESRRELTPDALRDNEFLFRENELVTFVPARGPAPGGERWAAPPRPT